VLAQKRNLGLLLLPDVAAIAAKVHHQQHEQHHNCCSPRANLERSSSPQRIRDDVRTRIRDRKALYIVK
jgi:hypothetical protein